MFQRDVFQDGNVIPKNTIVQTIHNPVDPDFSIKEITDKIPNAKVNIRQSAENSFILYKFN